MTEEPMSPSRDAGLRSALGEAIRTLGKAALALGVFGTLFFGSQWSAHRQVNAALASLPLPDKIVQGDCAIWFMGSSSMSRWATLQRDMSPWSTHNRSVSGATLNEISRRFANEQDPAPPQAIVFYAGENDIAFGVPLPTVIAKIDEFLHLKNTKLGAVPVLILSIKPSPSRWDQRAAQVAFNAAMQKLAAGRGDVHFVDTQARLLLNGKPGPFFGEDQLHLNEAGYSVLSDEVRHAIDADLPAAVVRRCTADKAG
jgi:lysophospholipase L1-like esterase